jgi:hypothetical protein
MGFRIDLCGVALEVDTDHSEFARYLEAQFPPGDRPSSGPPEVTVRVRWTEGPRPTLTPAAVFPDWQAETRIDRHVWAGPDRLLALRFDDAPAIALAHAHGGRQRRFELRYHFTLGADGWRETVKRWLRWRRLAPLRRSRLSTLTYYAVYYPAWYHLEARGAAHPLHAGALAVGGRGLLLGGLPGCGKSTLVASLLGEPGVELLADNVVLHDTARVYGCFEPLLLDAATRSWLTQHVRLEPLGRRHVFARDAFHVPHRTDGVPLAAALVVARGRETRLVRLPADECARMLLASNEVAKEVRRYHILAALLGMAERDALAHAQERAAHLERLLAGVPCYGLEVREGTPAEALPLLRGLVSRADEVAS